MAPLIRTTFNPAVEIFVGPAEFLDLSRQGLIYEGEDPPASEPLALKIRLVESTESPDEYEAQIEAEEVI